MSNFSLFWEKLYSSLGHVYSSFPGIITLLLVLPCLVYAAPETESETEEVKRDPKSKLVPLGRKSRIAERNSYQSDHKS